MAEFSVNFLPFADNELIEIGKYIKSLAGAKSAEKITSKILHYISLLENQPCLGFVPKDERLAEKGYRILVCDKYLCFYKILGNIIEIHHIVDGRRNYVKYLLSE